MRAALAASYEMEYTKDLAEGSSLMTGHVCTWGHLTADGAINYSRGR